MGSTPSSLPLSDIVVVDVSVANGSVAPRPFNQGLIVGSSTVIPSYGANARIRQYASLAEMVTDGFTTNDPEYIAAGLYFSQAAVPQFVWIGRQDLTAIQTAIPHSGAAGTGYAIGDTVTPTQAGGSNAKLVVLTVNAGAVLTLGTTIGNQGTGYSVAASLPTTTSGAGTGLEVDITAVGETLLQAVEACSLVNQQWYPVMCCGAVDADHLALAAWSTANWMTSMYFGSTADSSIPAGTAGNLAIEMQTAKYRAYLSYNTTQTGDEFPNNIYAAAAIIGVVCGLNTGLAGSAFTLNLKSLVGIAPEPLTQTQYAAITAANCNTCASFGPYDGYIVSGILSSGEFFDQILDRAMLVNLIQTNLMNLLVSVPKIPQTDPGEHQLIAQVENACAQEALIGYIGPGVWEGETVLNLTTGQALPQGYFVQAQSFTQQSSGDRAARKAMPIYAAILEAGAVHSVTVNVNVQL